MPSICAASDRFIERMIFQRFFLTPACLGYHPVVFEERARHAYSITGLGGVRACAAGCAELPQTTRDAARVEVASPPAQYTIPDAAAARCVRAAPESLGTGGRSGAGGSRRQSPSRPPPPADLWQRIRGGFQMANLQGPLVQEWEQWYSTRPDYVGRMIDRSSHFLYHVIEEVERRGMPTEIALLPMIESAYNPKAYSRSHASGMWQFIPSTGKDYGLRQNFWYDGRRDPIAATGAALDYLEKLYGMFGNWELALAAYNWGEGAVGRAIARNQAKGLPTDYESLTMPPETRNYVPKLQAVKNIVANPAGLRPHARRHPQPALLRDRHGRAAHRRQARRASRGDAARRIHVPESRAQQARHQGERRRDDPAAARQGRGLPAQPRRPRQAARLVAGLHHQAQRQARERRGEARHVARHAQGSERDRSARRRSSPGRPSWCRSTATPSRTCPTCRRPS